jgi:AbrB family transcriptional regulator (stage V sporulation protein T)
VVVPKEIRRTLRIREGDPLEIYTDRDGEIILKKYSPIGELSQFSKQYAEALAQNTGYIVSITDRDQHIAVAGNGKKDLMSQPVSRQLDTLMNERENHLAHRGERKFIPVTEGQEENYTAQMICPIIAEGDAIGSVILTTKDEKVKMGELEIKLAASAANFLGRQLE